MDVDIFPSFGGTVLGGNDDTLQIQLQKDNRHASSRNSSKLKVKRNVYYKNKLFNKIFINFFHYKK